MSYRPALLVFFLILVIYLLFAGRFKFYFPKTNRDYFSRLSHSFLSGKLDIPYPGYSPNDLSFSGGKYYLYWGPLPAIILTPIVFFFGTDISDIFYTAIFGAVNVFLMYCLFREFKQYIKIKLSDSDLILLTFCFAFGTIHFYLSTLGTVWFTSQIMALTAFIISVLLLFRYLNRNKSKYLVLSIFFLGFASLGKYTFLLSIPLYFGLLYREHRLTGFNILKLVSTLSFFIFLILVYNTIRFGSPFENGLTSMAVNSKFYQDVERFGYFNFYYIGRNIYYFILNPIQLIPKLPIIKPDPEGNSILFTSPIFFLIIYGWYKRYFKFHKMIFRLLFISSLLMLFPVFLYYGVGWYQFGYRYALDIYPFLFLILLLIANKYKKITLLSLVIISILINVAGTFWMMDFGKYAYF